jgi:hypothetical protein
MSERALQGSRNGNMKDLQGEQISTIHEDEVKTPPSQMIDQLRNIQNSGVLQDMQFGSMVNSIQAQQQ